MIVAIAPITTIKKIVGVGVIAITTRMITAIAQKEEIPLNAIILALDTEMLKIHQIVVTTAVTVPKLSLMKIIGMRMMMNGSKSVGSKQ